MTIDVSKIEIGDKVHLEFTVIGSGVGGTKVIKLSNKRNAPQFYLDPAMWGGGANFTIVEHIPAPWEPKAGDLIKVKGDQPRWVIVCVDPDGDWVVKVIRSNYKHVIRKQDFHQFELDKSDSSDIISSEGQGRKG